MGKKGGTLVALIFAGMLADYTRSKKMRGLNGVYNDVKVSRKGATLAKQDRFSVCVSIPRVPNIAGHEYTVTRPLAENDLLG